MSDADDYRCFVGSLSWNTSDVDLKDAFGKFGRVTETKVVLDKFSGRSRGFGFVTFDDKKAMEEAVEAMNGVDLDGRNITVERAQPQGSGRDRDGDSRGGGGRDFGGGRGGGRGGGGDCYKCGKPGHFARECPSGDGGDRYGGRDDRYSSRDDRYGGRDDRYGGRDGGRDDRYGSRDGGRDDRYGGSNGSSRYGPDRGGDRYSGSRDGGSRSGGGGGGDRYSRDRSGPYERRTRDEY